MGTPASASSSALRPSSRKQPTRGSNLEQSSVLAISVNCLSLPPMPSSRANSKTGHAISALSPLLICGISSRRFHRGADIHVCGIETRLDALPTLHVSIFVEFSCVQTGQHRDESRCRRLKAAPLPKLSIISTHDYKYTRVRSLRLSQDARRAPAADTLRRTIRAEMKILVTVGAGFIGFWFVRLYAQDP